jgi:hypothetical protein
VYNIQGEKYEAVVSDIHSILQELLFEASIKTGLI